MFTCQHALLAADLCVVAAMLTVDATEPYLYARCSMLSHSFLGQDDNQANQDTGGIQNFLHAAFDARGRGTCNSTADCVYVTYVAASNQRLLGIDSYPTRQRMLAIPFPPAANRDQFEELYGYALAGGRTLMPYLLHLASKAAKRSSTTTRKIIPNVQTSTGLPTTWQCRQQQSCCWHLICCPTTSRRNCWTTYMARGPHCR